MRSLKKNLIRAGVPLLFLYMVIGCGHDTYPVTPTQPVAQQPYPPNGVGGTNGMFPPGTNGMFSPGANGMFSPGANGMFSPGANGMFSPGINGNGMFPPGMFGPAGFGGSSGMVGWGSPYGGGQVMWGTGGTQFQQVR